SLGRSVRVPLDHDAPDAGSFDLHYELGAPFDLSKPTVFYAQDGQQFRGWHLDCLRRLAAFVAWQCSGDGDFELEGAARNGFLP
ncbi:MAG: hypothetical protein GY719_42530, partial [bacterium]|nr:hypothetical protein [bacterium]